MKFIRYIIAELLGGVLIFYWLICKMLFSSNKQGILSIYFHNPKRYQFSLIVRFLRFLGYTFISVDDVYEHYNKGKVLPTKPALITFDDGWGGNMKLLSIIEKYQVNSTFFITTDAISSGNFWWEKVRKKTRELDKLKKAPNSERVSYLERLGPDNIARSALTWEQLELMAQSEYITLGAHTHTHPILTNCSKKDVILELKEPIIIMNEKLDINVKYFAYPNGDYSDLVWNQVKEVGYELAFTTNHGYIDDKAELFLLPRNSVNDGGGILENISKATGVWYVFFKAFK